MWPWQWTFTAVRQHPTLPWRTSLHGACHTIAPCVIWKQRSIIWLRDRTWIPIKSDQLVGAWEEGTQWNLRFTNQNLPLVSSIMVLTHRSGGYQQNPGSCFGKLWC